MKYLPLLFFLLIQYASFGQSLLVNGSFEEENICTEYDAKCSPEGWISANGGFDNYFKDRKRAYAGLYCIAVEAGVSKKQYNRTFFRSRLLCGLRSNNQYLVEFYIKSPHPVTDSMGIYFSSKDFLFERKPLHTIAPSMFVKDDPVFRMKDDSSWQKISLKYTATGNEVFFTLANFSKRDINGETGIDKDNHFFVFIDNISLTPLDPNERICPGWQQVKREIYEQDERHQYLQRLVRTYRNNPPEAPALSKTVTLVRKTLVLPDVLFESGKSDMQPAAFAMLDSFCKTLRDKMIDSLVVEGHTDSTGTEELNQQLSAGRANQVAGYLNKCIISNDPVIIVRGLGDKKPVESNSTPDGRRKNRRVDISLWLKEQN